MRLSFEVFFAANAFSVFFYMVVVYFAFSYQILGNQAGGHPDPEPHGDGDDYERLTPFIALIMYSYRTSIGDLDVPNAMVWADLNNDAKTTNQKGTIIVYLIWIVWMVE